MSSSTRGFKNRPMTRVALKRRRVNLSPQSDDDTETSPSSLGALVRKIHNSLGELDILRRKSSNLNGKTSGSMRDEITNIGKFVDTIAKGAESLKTKFEALVEENRNLREKRDIETAGKNSARNISDNRDFLTPKTSQLAVPNMDLDMAQMTVEDFDKPDDEFKLVQRKPRAQRAPLARSYAEMLRVDLPPGKSQTRGFSQIQVYSQRQAADAARASTDPPPITIRVKGKGIPYEDIVKKVKAGVKPDEHQIKVLSLRKNVSQELELRVRGTEENVARFKTAISVCIGDEGSALRIQPMALMHVGDLEAEITADEIAADLGKAANLEPQEIKITSLRPAYGNTQKATVKLPRAAALALQNLNRVSVGYVTCRVQIRSFEQRCFRCGESGHLASECKGPDKTGLCFRCSSKEHQIRSCPEKREKSNANSSDKRE